ncbi:hypothetical protein H9K76_13890 [Diaphorobacter ruginosibacter]|uniref:Uncharacterized protein n=1 Tax=Diaphorobacter ruginosibacter TaxID=1715720 RepID=A0A7G9RJE2_9BURK|nr:hypothetical protein [Diaphorobacter ruginosibacter]QNN55717.1 hypothetical protein H9K76_13890 [Diaphorobacter ruginosibacter]
MKKIKITYTASRKGYPDIAYFSIFELGKEPSREICTFHLVIYAQAHLGIILEVESNVTNEQRLAKLGYHITRVTRSFGYQADRHKSNK